jgi:hypothetical protein
MADHVHKTPVCSFGAHNPHAPSCANMRGKEIACGTIVDPAHPNVGSALCRHRDTPLWQPGKWNKAGVQGKNNCYNYACDSVTGTFAQPGVASGNIPGGLTCADYTASAVADGLSEKDCDKPCPLRCWKVALVIAPGDDFHWYRQDADGTWSHKPGGTPATQSDASGNPITDPRTADRDYRGVGGANYTLFCGCFCVCPPVTIASLDGFTGGHALLAMRYDVPTIEVSYGLFSGRENPTFTLTDPQIKTFAEMLAKLPETKSIPSTTWQHFTVTNFHEVPNMPNQVTLRDGIVEMLHGEKVSYHKDSKNVFAWLKKALDESDHGELVKTVEAKRATGETEAPGKTCTCGTCA